MVANVEMQSPLSAHRARVMHAVYLARQRHLTFARAYNLIGDLERQFERGFWNQDPRVFWTKSGFEGPRLDL